MQKHSCDFRVYFEDTDAGGVMYHANYINFCERARTEMLRTGGYTNMGIKDDLGVIFVARHMEVDYIKPLFLEDLVTVETHLSSMKNTSMVFEQSIKKDGDTVFHARITLVCVKTDPIKPHKIPETVKETFLPYCSQA